MKTEKFYIIRRFSKKIAVITVYRNSYGSFPDFEKVKFFNSFPAAIAYKNSLENH